MKIEFIESFNKDLSKLQNPILKRLFSKIEDLKKSYHLQENSNIKKLSGYNNLYRIKIGDYRLGFRLENNTIILERFLHRKDIYKKFPN